MHWKEFFLSTPPHIPFRFRFPKVFKGLLYFFFFYFNSWRDNHLLSIWYNLLSLLLRPSAHQHSPYFRSRTQWHKAHGGLVYNVNIPPSDYVLDSLRDPFKGGEKLKRANPVKTRFGSDSWLLCHIQDSFWNSPGRRWGRSDDAYSAMWNIREHYNALSVL